MKTFGIIALLVIGMAWFVAMTYQDAHPVTVASAPQVTSRNQNSVYLKAAPGNSIVQMFERVGPGDEGQVTEFPDGLKCIKLRDAKPVVIEGIHMSFYLLNCNKVTGYVNAKWVY